VVRRVCSIDEGLNLLTENLKGLTELRLLIPPLAELIHHGRRLCAQRSNGMGDLVVGRDDIGEAGVGGGDGLSYLGSDPRNLSAEALKLIGKVLVDAFHPGRYGSEACDSVGIVRLARGGLPG
jgi:hypothetical protein